MAGQRPPDINNDDVAAPAVAAAWGCWQATVPAVEAEAGRAELDVTALPLHPLRRRVTIRQDESGRR